MIIDTLENYIPTSFTENYILSAKKSLRQNPIIAFYLVFFINSLIIHVKMSSSYHEVLQFQIPCYWFTNFNWGILYCYLLRFIVLQNLTFRQRILRIFSLNLTYKNMKSILLISLPSLEKKIWNLFDKMSSLIIITGTL